MGLFKKVLKEENESHNYGNKLNLARTETRSDDREGERTELIFGTNEKILKEKILERVEVIREVYAPFQSQRIGVIPLTGGAGGTFLSMCLAKALVEEKVLSIFLEICDNSIYDILNFEYDNEDDFFDFFQASRQGEYFRGKKNLLFGVNWIIQKKKCNVVNNVELIKNILQTLESGVTVCDFSSFNKVDEIKSLLIQMDKLIVIIDALPSKIVKSYDTLKELENLGIEMIFIINKDCRNISEKEIGNALNIEKHQIFKIPMVETKYIYDSEYRGKLAYDISFVKKSLEKPLKHLIKILKIGDRI